jgi:hypothetical protein
LFAFIDITIRDGERLTITRRKKDVILFLLLLRNETATQQIYSAIRSKKTDAPHPSIQTEWQLLVPGSPFPSTSTKRPFFAGAPLVGGEW